MSPRELYREIEAAQGRERDAAEARIHQAWQTAALLKAALVGKMPEWEDLKAQALKPAPVAAATAPRLAPVQSKAAMAAQVRMLADYYGIPVRRTVKA